MVTKRATRSGSAIGVALSGLLVLSVLINAVILGSPAQAQVSGLGVAVTPSFSSPVTVGAQDRPALLQLSNQSFGVAGTAPVVMSDIRVNPACAGGNVIGDPLAPTPCPNPEPRPFPALPILDLDATSGPGTTCPGGPFIITGPDAEGDYTFTPTTGPVTLAPVGQPGSSCTITFTFDVIQRPLDGATAVVAAILATSLLPPPNAPPPSPQTGSTTVVVLQATPAIATLVSVPPPAGGGTPTVPVGTTFTDTATVTGVANGPTPTGTVTFTVFQDPPGAAPCSGPSTVLGPSPLTGPAPTPPTPPTATATSAPVTATTAGTYRFVATYSGDVNYAAMGPTPCDAPGENVAVTQLGLTMVTQASTNATDVPPGTTVTDTAVLTPPAGGPAPTGTVTYTLVGPNPDPACNGPVVGTSTVPAGSPSGPFTVTLPGTYNFVATYSGDAVYEPITTPVGCGVPAERFAVARQPVQLVTQASTNSPTVAPGTTVTDVATVTPPAGFPAPTGTVTYILVGPNPNATCTAPVVGAPSTVPVGQPSGPYTVTAPGTYNFVATYSGDANYLPITTPVGCGDPAERFTVATLPIGLTTQASTNSPNVPPGTPVTDLAVFTPPPGGPTPTGTVTYTLVGPNPNATCTAPVFGAPSTAPVGEPAGPYAPTAPGTYNFVATYSGDANYAPITTPVGCGDPDEIFAVALQPLNLVTQASTNSTTVAPGTAVTDLATLTPTNPGAPAPTGTVTYTLVGPNPDPACTGPVFGTSTVPAGSTSAPFAVTAPGTYNFVATYSGDGFYAPITTPVGCGVPAERFTVATLPVTLVTQASTNSTTVAPGTTITDLATVQVPAGGPPATGTVTYTLVGANPNATCTAPVVGTSTVPVGQPSGPFTVTVVGTYNFVATYSGDANYSPVTTPAGCGDPNEIFAVALQPITLVTQASTNSTTVAPGTAVTDLAIFTPPAGAPAPTGTVTYTLVGPNPAPNCTGPVVGTSTVAVGSPSAPFTVTAPGTYNFVATYSGDAFYAPITTPVGCGVPEERFTVVTPADLSITKICGAGPVAPGAIVNCSVTVANAGPFTAENLSVTDDLPSGVTLVGTPSGDGFTCVGADPFTCTLPSLAPNASATFTFAVRAENIAPGTPLINRATVSSASHDPNLADNTATATTSVISCTITGAGDILGTEGDDVICGSTGRDRIAGLGGDDVIFGLAGDDQISGGAGNDVLSGGDGNDELVGGDGNDQLFGNGGGLDRLSGGGGDDYLNIVDGSGDDFAVGGDHMIGDTCVVDPGDSTALCEGSTSTTTLPTPTTVAPTTTTSTTSTTSTVPPTTTTSTTTSTSTVPPSSTTTTTSTTVPPIGTTTTTVPPTSTSTTSTSTTLPQTTTTTVPSTTTTTVGTGPLLCNGLVPTMVGTPSSDTIFGTPGRDIIAGLGGGDRIIGGGGDDVICGGEGDDTLVGGDGDDDLFGGNGNDILDGGADNDRLFGEAGNDTITAGDGNDALDGGANSDRCFGDAGVDSATACELVHAVP